MPQNEVGSYFGQKPELSLDDFLKAFYPDSKETIRLRTIQAKSAPKGTTPPLNWESSRAELTAEESQCLTCELNKQNGIYFLVNAGGHEDKDITRVNAFFMESDEGSLNEQHAKLDSSPLETSIRVETKKSVHAYWGNNILDESTLIC